jgi:glycosyltransferase involved in cell wall biosynthesis
MPHISVAICTHNPHLEYLSRALNGLKSQTLPVSQWEFLLIDNASDVPVSGLVDLAWHPNARVIVESKLGITSARIRAMREFAGDLLVFLDDDNVMSPDYLLRCSELFAERPDLGAASGCIMPEYEAPPPEWFGPYESWIAVRRITQSAWSNFNDPRSEPVTAGMCLRRTVAEAHVNESVSNPTQFILGSRGSSLLRGEDVALSKIALKRGYTVGQFAHLHLLHLIPKRRVNPKYLFDLYSHLCASGHLISWVDDAGRQPIRLGWRALLRAAYRFVKGNNIQRRLVIEELRGFRLARSIVKDWSEGQPAVPVPQST